MRIVSLFPSSPLCQFGWQTWFGCLPRVNGFPANIIVSGVTRVTDKNIDSNLIRGKVTLGRAENREMLLPLVFRLPLIHPPNLGGTRTNVNVSASIRNQIDHGNSPTILLALIKGKIGWRQVFSCCTASVHLIRQYVILQIVDCYRLNYRENEYFSVWLIHVGQEYRSKDPTTR